MISSKKTLGVLLSLMMVLSVFAVAPVAAQGELEVTGSSGDTTTQGDTATVTYTIENTGDATVDSYGINLNLNGPSTSGWEIKTIQPSTPLVSGASASWTSNNADWSSGETRTFKVVYNVPDDADFGTYTAELSGSVTGSATIEVTKATSNFQVTNVQAPSEVPQGTEIDVTATIKNTGNAEGTQDITWSLGGVSKTKSGVTIAAGSSTQVTFENIDTSGLQIDKTYTHTVSTDDDSASRQITILPPELPAGDKFADSQQTYWQGQQLYFNAGSDNAGETYQIRELSGNEAGTLAEEFQVDNNGEALIDTDDLEGRYVITDSERNILLISNGRIVGETDNAKQAAWEVVVQRLSVAFGAKKIQNKRGTQTVLEITDSNRANFNLVISADSLNQKTLLSVFPNSKAVGSSAVMVMGVQEGSKIQADFAGVPTGNYTFATTASDTTAAASADIQVVKAPPRNAFFVDTNLFSDQTGDPVEFTVGMQGTKRAQLEIGGPEQGYHIIAEVVDGNGNGQVDLVLNTYDVTGGNAGLTATSKGDSVAVTTIADRPSKPLAPIDYPMTLSVEDAAGAFDETAVGSVVVEERATKAAKSWIAPRGFGIRNAGDIAGAIGSSVTQNSNVADGDKAIIQMQVSGIYAQGAAPPTDSISVVQTNPGPNRNPVRLSSSDYSIVTNEPGDQFFVIIDTSDIGPGDIPTKGNEFPQFKVTFDMTGSVLAESGFTSVAESAKSTMFTVVPASASFEKNARKSDGSLVIQYLPESGQTVKGSTTLAPGTRVNVRAKVTGKYLQSNTDIVVSSDQTFKTVFDFSSLSAGDTLELTFRGGTISHTATAAIVNERDDAPSRSELVEQTKQLRQQVEDLRSQLQTTRTRLNEVRTQLEDAQEQLSQLQSQRDELQKQVDQLESQNSELQSQVNNLQSQVENKQSLLEEKNSTITDLNNTVSELRANLSEDGGGQPGFGVIVSLIALLSISFIALRRRD